MRHAAFALVLAVALPFAAAGQTVQASPAALQAIAEGDALMANNDLPGALRAYDRALQAAPRYSEAWRLKGVALLKLQRGAEALPAFERAIGIDPANTRAYVGRAGAKRGLGDNAGAMSDYDTAIRQDPNYSNAYMNRGGLRHALGDSAGALPDLNRAIETNPNNAGAWFSRGIVKNALGDKAGGAADLNRYLQMDPNGVYAAGARSELAKTGQAGSGAGNTSRLDRILQKVEKAEKAISGAAGTPAPTPRSAAPPAPAAPASGTAPASAAVPPSAPAPANTLRPLASNPGLNVSELLDETTWKRSNPLWGKSATAVTPINSKLPPVEEPAPLDINDLTPAHYAAAVAQAKESMRLVAGPTTPEEVRRFDAQWASLFDYPCQEIIAYLNKLNPLLAQFLASRAGAGVAHAAFDQAQFDMLTALDNNEPDDVADAAVRMNRQRALIVSLTKTMESVAAAVDALGPMPNPLEKKGRARRTHDQALELVQPSDFDGHWSGRQGDLLTLRTLRRFPDGTRLVYRYEEGGKAGRGAPMLGDRLWIAEKTKAGWLLLEWQVFRQVHMIETEPNRLSIQTTTLPDTAGVSVQTVKSVWTILDRSPKKWSVPVGAAWADVERTADQVGDQKHAKYIDWKRTRKDEFAAVSGGQAGSLAASRERDEKIAEIRQRAAQMRAADMAQAESSLSAAEYLAKSGGRPFDRAKEREQRAAAIDRSVAEFQVAELRKLGIEVPNLPESQAAPPDPAAEAARVRYEAEQAALKQQVAFHQANIAYFEQRIRQTEEQLNAATTLASREPIQWSLMVLQRNVQDEHDRITTLQTGEWTRTRTSFDEYCLARESERARKAADEWDWLARTMDRIERQISVAEPSDRERLRKMWTDRVRPDVIARHDFEAVRQVSKTIFDQTQAHWEKEAIEQEDIARVQDERLAVVQKVKTAADTSLMLLSMAGGPPGQALSAGYLALTVGYIEGNPGEAVKQVALTFSTAARIANAGMEGYMNGVLGHLEKYSENAGVMTLDESGAGVEGAIWGAGKEAAMAAGMKFVVVPAAQRLARSAVGLPAGAPRPTARQLIAQSEFRMGQTRGREIVDAFIEKSGRLADAQASRAPRAKLDALRAEADTAYTAIKANYHAKNYLKTFVPGKQAVSRYNAFDAANMNSYMKLVEQRLAAKGFAPQEHLLFSNSASKGGVGMDVDMGLKEPPRFIGSGPALRPNPDYDAFLNGLTRTERGITVRLTPAQYQAEAQKVMEQAFREHFRRPTDQAFLKFTYSGDPEAYKKLAWIGGEGLKTADFAKLNAGGPTWSRQAADVSGFKVNDLPRGHPQLGTYETLQEQCRGLAKDLSTKMIGAPRGAPINPAGPLGKAPAAVQQHFAAIRDAMDDFATNRIGPIEAERKIRTLTGGRGVAEVAAQFSVAMQGGMGR